MEREHGRSVPRAYDLAARREREVRREGERREGGRRPREEQDGFQPSMLTFKAFLHTQDDSITDSEALEKFAEYKVEFQRQQLNEFFVSHKAEEWFRDRYQPVARAARQEEVRGRVAARLEAFTTLLGEEGEFAGVAVEEEQAEVLVRLLDRTTSVFVASVHPAVTRAEVVEAAGRFPGFLRLCMSEPECARGFARKAWLTFERAAKIREICFSLNSVRLGEQEVKAVVNKDLSKRVRGVEWAHASPRVLEASVACCKQLVACLDLQAGLHTGGANPVLEDQHLEASRVLDRLVLYLRVVHSFDWYSQGAQHHPLEDTMPNRLGLVHARPGGEPRPVEEEEVEKVVARLRDRTEVFVREREAGDAPEAAKLGLKVEEDEVEKFMSASMQELEKDKWLCTLSQKKFKAPEFVRKHIINKFGDQVDEVKLDVEFFNAYLRDPLRPSMPAAPPGPRAAGAEERAGKRPLEQRREVQEQPAAKRSIKERLGNGGVRVTHSVKDPRAIVDYSDVDSFQVVDFDF